jgi:16S rRNA (uracil1498-N3)-methyltransferase
LFVEANLAAGGEISADREQARYLLKVLRRQAGAPLLLFNGRDGEWLARVEPLGRSDAKLMLETQTRPQPVDNGPWLIFAVIKRGPMELLAEKATELGASRLLPVRTMRSQSERINESRMARIVTEAAEQSERLTVPKVAPVQTLETLLADWPDDRLLIIGDESRSAPPMLSHLAGLPTQPFGFMSGPEGGFAPGELDGLDDLPFVARIGLGPRVLRAETAAIAGLTLAQAALGDFNENRM